MEDRPRGSEREHRKMVRRPQTKGKGGNQPVAHAIVVLVLHRAEPTESEETNCSSDICIHHVTLIPRLLQDQVRVAQFLLRILETSPTLIPFPKQYLYI